MSYNITDPFDINSRDRRPLDLGHSVDMTRFCTFENIVQSVLLFVSYLIYDECCLSPMPMRYMREFETT